MSDEQKPSEQKATDPEAAPAPQLAEPQEPFSPKHTREFFLSVLNYGQEEHDAKAGILQELIDLILPEARAIAQPIRAKTAEDQQSPEALEQQFGVSVRERAAEWLHEPAIRLAAGSRKLEPRGGSQQVSGGELRRELFMLTNGKLVIVETVGTWHLEGSQQVSGDTLVGTRQVSPSEVLRAFDFVSMLKALLETLFDGASTLKDQGQQNPDVVERSGRFFTIIAQVAVGMKENADQLRRVGDTLA